jgi:histidine triad (HIT) family protein
MSDCLFCRIVAGEIPATIVAEDERCIAFRDITPQAPTHVLVIPRAHHATLAEVAAVDPGTVAAIVRMAGAAAAADGFDDYRLAVNTGAGAGQTVFHAHVHVVAGRPLAWPPG